MSAALSDNVRGALIMMGSMAGFTLNDACIKATGGALPLSQILVIRGALTICLLVLLAWHLNALRFDLDRRSWALIGLRCVGEVGATYFFLTALLNLPFASVTAIIQILPLTVTLGAFLLFREPIGWRRLLAIIVGFGGMLLIVRPGPDGISPYALYALGAVACVTLRDLATRRLPPDVPSLTVTIVGAVAVTMSAAVVGVSVDWVPLDLRLLGLLVASSVFILGGYLFSVMVMRVGEISFIAPFRYTSLVWALALGWLFFGEWPDGISMLGGIIVVASGLFTFFREQMQARR